jgi:hypothetical protein
MSTASSCFPLSGGIAGAGQHRTPLVSIARPAGTASVSAVASRPSVLLFAAVALRFLQFQDPRLESCGFQKEAKRAPQRRYPDIRQTGAGGRRLGGCAAKTARSARDQRDPSSQGVRGAMIGGIGRAAATWPLLAKTGHVAGVGIRKFFIDNDLRHRPKQRRYPRKVARSLKKLELTRSGNAGPKRRDDIREQFGPCGTDPHLATFAGSAQPPDPGRLPHSDARDQLTVAAPSPIRPPQKKICQIFQLRRSPPT